MGRKKRAVARGWEAINKQRDEESKKTKDQGSKEEKITKEEHEERIKKLRELGLIK